MDFAAQSYVAQVDRILAAAVSLFPAQSDSGELQRSAAPSGGDLPEGDSGLASAAGEAAARYRSNDARAVALSDALHGSVAEAVRHAQEANESAKAISHTAATGARAVLAEGPDPHNLVLLVSQMDDRLAAMQEHIEQTRQRLQASAQKITAHGADMSQA
ncbi:hypothetical protein [Mycolicibacterium vinylchloridicum]|uniref:hypothetical protein n=1 Tax=Mycolicibacterium vinylchloridicum TaxID=2736928 RepID=UPI0002EE16FD|nr:hypothetical protein [Mycolicibacterium vinylchloridicum]